MINHGIEPQDLKIIHAILGNYQHVYAFGSRVKGTYRPFSDLDICIKQPLSDYEIEILSEQLRKSDLPFKVDIVLYNEVDDYFKKRIDQEAVDLSELV